MTGRAGSRVSPILAALALVALAVIAAVALRRPTDDFAFVSPEVGLSNEAESRLQAADPGTSERLRFLEQQLGRIATELEELTAKQAATIERQGEILEMLRRLEMRAPSGTQASDSDTAYLQQLAQAEFEARRAENFRALASRHSSEAVDRIFSASASDTIRQMAEGPEFADSALMNVDCRTSMCRLELTHVNRQAMDGFVRSLPLELGWSSSLVMDSTERADGSLSSLIFLSRNDP